MHTGPAFVPSCARIGTGSSSWTSNFSADRPSRRSIPSPSTRAPSVFAMLADRPVSGAPPSQERPRRVGGDVDASGDGFVGEVDNGDDEDFDLSSFDPSEWLDESELGPEPGADELYRDEPDGNLDDGKDTLTVTGSAKFDDISLSAKGAKLKVVKAEPVFGNGSFAALGLSNELCDALSEAGIERPTRVQQRGIPPILGGADVILGAATGSGKTYTYLLPLVMSLKAAEDLRQEGEPALRVARRPRAIVIVPTRELAEQALAVAKELSHVVKFRVIGANTGAGSSGLKKLKDLFARSPVDVLVTTTGRLLQLLDAKAIDIRFASHVVVDEVDTMFDAGFGPELQRILRASRGRGNVVNKPQYIAVGATHPKAAELVYDVEFPGAKRIDVDLHLPPPGLDARFIRTTSEGKLQELVALLGDSRKDGDLNGGRLIIFCNTISSARFVEHFLSESGYTTASVHGEIPPERRASEFESFKTGAVQLLVCTDIAARGLDNLDIAHVIIFDFPTSAVDYIHRAGRTARAGATGRVTSLVLKRDLGLARAIERSGKEKQDALVSARIAREKEEARKLQEEENRRQMQVSSAFGDAEEALHAGGRRSPSGGEKRRGSSGVYGQGSGRGRGSSSGRGRGGASRGPGSRGRSRGSRVSSAYGSGSDGTADSFGGGSSRFGGRGGASRGRGKGGAGRRGSSGGRAGGRFSN